MREGAWAGGTYLAFGTLALLWAAGRIVRPPEISPYASERIRAHAALYRYGDSVVLAVVGAALLALGVLALRARSRPVSPEAMVDVHEMPGGLGAFCSIPFFGIALLLTGIWCTRALERGIRAQDVALSILLFLMMAGTVVICLHYRRTTLLDPAARTFEIRYGKPWTLWRRAWPFSDFRTLTLEEVPRRRLICYRLVAGGGQAKPRLIEFWYSRDAAVQRVWQISKLTGWIPQA